MNTIIQKVTGCLPNGLGAIQQEARNEGYNFIDRLIRDWETGNCQFQRTNEVLMSVQVDGILVGIGGITKDPNIPDALRLRRFYIRTDFRRLGLANLLCEKLRTAARDTKLSITVNAGTRASYPFWEAAGFVPSGENSITHIYSAKSQIFH